MSNKENANNEKQPAELTDKDLDQVNGGFALGESANADFKKDDIAKDQLSKEVSSFTGKGRTAGN